jgi:hypothetical protein
VIGLAGRKAWLPILAGSIGSLLLAVWGQEHLVRDYPSRRTTLAIWLVGLSGFALLSLRDRLRQDDASARCGPHANVPTNLGMRWMAFGRHFGADLTIAVSEILQARRAEVPIDSESTRASRSAAETNEVATIGDRVSIDPPRVLLGVLAISVSFVVWRLVGPRSPGEPVYDVLGLWILSMVAILLAVGGTPTRRSLARLWRDAGASRREIALVAAITVGALLIRIFPYGAYPRTMGGDEGVFAIQALEVSAGNAPNYFAVVNTGNINFTFAALAAVMEVFGETVGGSRLLSAGMGAAAIPATYLLARTSFGRLVATMSALVLGTSFMALFWSRNTMNEASAFLFAPLVIWLLDQGLIGRRRLPALLAGFAVGLSLYFYSSNRVLLPLTLLYAGYALLFWFRRSDRNVPAVVRSMVPLIALTATGLLISAMPILSHSWHYPGSFNRRMDQVSVFTSGWLEREAVVRDQSQAAILFDQFRIATLVPFGNVQRGTFIHGDPPLLGWPVVLFAALGLAIVTLTFWRRSHFGLAACFWVTAAGTAITIGAHEPHKLVTSISVLAILTSLGIVSIVRLVTSLLQTVGRIAAVTSLVCVLVIGGWSLNAYFADPDQYDIFADSRTVLAHSLAANAAKLGPGTTVYFLGAPYMIYDGFSNLRFIARDATGIDLVDPITPADTPPTISGPTIFAAIAPREHELAVVRRWFPQGIEERYELPDLGHLFTTITVIPEEATREDEANPAAAI